LCTSKFLDVYWGRFNCVRPNLLDVYWGRFNCERPNFWTYTGDASIVYVKIPCTNGLTLLKLVDKKVRDMHQYFGTYKQNFIRHTILIFIQYHTKESTTLACFSVASKTNTPNTLLAFLLHPRQTHRIHCLSFCPVQHKPIDCIVCIFNPFDMNKSTTLLVFLTRWHPHPHPPHHVKCF
jgi:hypothetical protein